MNRQYKRLMKKQEAQKKKAPTRSPRPAPGAGAPKRGRTPPIQFIKEVWQELRKVNWPTTQEVVGYSLVVLVSVIVIAALIFAMDYVFTKAILALFGVDV